MALRDFAFPPHAADPTLTTGKLMEVVMEVQCRWRNLGVSFGVRWVDQINWIYRSNQQRLEAVIDDYVKFYPTPSWKRVARALHEMKRHDLADEVTTKYVRGMDI